MTDPDVYRVRHPSIILRVVAALLCAIALSSLPSNLGQIFQGNWGAVVSASLGIVGTLSCLSIAAPLALLRWETVVDRRSRTVTRTVRLILTLRMDQYRFEDFRGVVLRRLLGNALPDGPEVLAVMLIGPGLRLDFDDPGKFRFAGSLHFYARVSAHFRPAAQLALADWLARSTGLKFRDLTARNRRAAPAPRRPTFGTWSSDQVDPALEFPEVNRRKRWLLWFIVIDGSLAVLFMAVALPSLPNFDLAGYLGALLVISLLPSGAAVGLSYRTLVVIDFPNRQVRRSRSFLGSRSEKTYPVDHFEEVLVRELKIPLWKSPHRTVELAEGRFNLVLYDDGGVPRSLELATSQGLGVRAEGLDRGGRCLASAETLAALIGLPMRVVSGYGPVRVDGIELPPDAAAFPLDREAIP